MPATPPRSATARLAFWQVYGLGRLPYGGVTLGAFAYAWYSDGHLEGARTAAFSTLIVAELLRTFGARSERQTVWQIGFFSNRQLCVIVAVSFAMQLAISQITALQQLFGITPISLRQWSAWIVLGAVPLLVLELRKSSPMRVRVTTRHHVRAARSPAPPAGRRSYSDGGHC